MPLVVIERKQSFLHSINKDKECVNKAINANAINRRSINAKQRSHKRKIDDGKVATIAQKELQSRLMRVLTSFSRKKIDLLENFQ